MSFCKTQVPPPWLGNLGVALVTFLLFECNPSGVTLAFFPLLAYILFGCELTEFSHYSRDERRRYQNCRATQWRDKFISSSNQESVWELSSSMMLVIEISSKMYSQVPKCLVIDVLSSMSSDVSSSHQRPLRGYWDFFQNVFTSAEVSCHWCFVLNEFWCLLLSSETLERRGSRTAQQCKIESNDQHRARWSGMQNANTIRARTGNRVADMEMYVEISHRCTTYRRDKLTVLQLIKFVFKMKNQFPFSGNSVHYSWKLGERSIWINFLFAESVTIKFVAEGTNDSFILIHLYLKWDAVRNHHQSLIVWEWDRNICLCMFVHAPTCTGAGCWWAENESRNKEPNDTTKDETHFKTQQEFCLKNLHD